MDASAVTLTTALSMTQFPVENTKGKSCSKICSTRRGERYLQGFSFCKNLDQNCIKSKNQETEKQ